MSAGILPLDWTGLTAGAPQPSAAPGPPAGITPFDWTGVPVGPFVSTARRANAQVSVDVRDAYQVILRQMQRERELVRTRRLLRLQEMTTLSNIQRAALEYERRLKNARASYAVLLAEL